MSSWARVGPPTSQDEQAHPRPVGTEAQGRCVQAAVSSQERGLELGFRSTLSLPEVLPETLGQRQTGAHGPWLHSQPWVGWASFSPAQADSRSLLGPHS